MRFHEVLEAAEQLSLDEREALIALLQRRSSAVRRAALANDVKEARQELQTGRCQQRTLEELRKEIQAASEQWE
jgi:hypothetical protein